MARKQRSTRKRGGGYAVNLSESVSVGNPAYQPYSGMGKDCSDASSARPGYLEGGMSGLRGGSRRTRGGYRLEVAPFEDAPLPVPPMVGAPGVPMHAQKGGRYEVNPGFLSENAMGASGPAPFGSIACERGAPNSMNMRGGAVPLMGVGQVDSMRYHAPTAGYGHSFETYPGTGAVGGLMMNTPFEARSMNPACLTTGGMRTRKQRTLRKRTLRKRTLRKRTLRKRTPRKQRKQRKQRK